MIEMKEIYVGKIAYDTIAIIRDEHNTDDEVFLRRKLHKCIYGAISSVLSRQVEEILDSI